MNNLRILLAAVFHFACPVKKDSYTKLCQFELAVNKFQDPAKIFCMHSPVKFRPIIAKKLEVERDQCVTMVNLRSGVNIFFGFFASLAREGKQITETKGERMIAG